MLKVIASGIENYYANAVLPLVRPNYAFIFVARKRCVCSSPQARLCRGLPRESRERERDRETGREREWERERDRERGGKREGGV